MEACGIDVHTAARNADFTIEVATSRDPCHELSRPSACGLNVEEDDRFRVFL